jgi:hypothetical protein
MLCKYEYMEYCRSLFSSVSRGPSADVERRLPQAGLYEIELFYDMYIIWKLHWREIHPSKDQSRSNDTRCKLNFFSQHPGTIINFCTMYDFDSNLAIHLYKKTPL